MHERSYDRIRRDRCNAAKEKFAPRAKAWAEKYREEKLIYTMGSGSELQCCLFFCNLPADGDAVDSTLLQSIPASISMARLRSPIARLPSS